MPALAAPDVYIFDEAMQSQAYNIGQEAIIKTLEGKTYQHGKVSPTYIVHSPLLLPTQVTPCPNETPKFTDPLIPIADLE